MVRLFSMPTCCLFLFFAIFLYAIAGSPTPDHPGIVEGVIGGLLVLSIGAAGLQKLGDMRQGAGVFITSLKILILCGLILPTLSGALLGNDPWMMARDMAAFLFLGLAVFMQGRMSGQAQAVLCMLLVFAGISFSLRTLWPAFNLWSPEGELLYLSNSPLALFAALFLAGELWKGMQNFDMKFLPVLALMGGLLALIVAAMLLDVQRATVGAIFISLGLWAVIGFFKAPLKAVLPLCVFAAAAVLLYPFLQDMAQAMIHKTSDVGLNMRQQEARAVVEALSASPVHLFLGQGWGAVFASPAVGNLDVNYTHSFLTTMLLKGGIVLCLVAVIMCIAAMYEIFLIFQKDSVRGLSLFWPFVIPVLLYASHKSLDFGLVLLMIGVWSDAARALHAGPASCKTKE